MNENNSQERDETRDLLVEAGHPAEIPANDLATIRAAARSAWSEMSSAPVFEGRSSYRRSLAMAATLVLALTAVWLYYRTDTSPVEVVTVATVELVRGEVSAPRNLVAGAKIGAGTELATDGAGAGTPPRVALRMASGHSVRLDADSKIRFDSDLRLVLERGAVYVDSGGQGAPSSLEVVTPLGTVHEIGTQYEVRLLPDGRGATRVRVREGSVSLSQSGRTISASRGEQVTVAVDGQVDRDRMAVSGPEWSWILAAAPALDTDGRSQASYLDWVSRETGLEIHYSDPDLALSAAENTVVGNVDGLTPEQTLSVILPGSRLGYRIDGDTLVISDASGR